MLTGSAPKRHSACLTSAVERCFRLLPRDLRWSALSTLLEAQMITRKTAISLVARGGTTDCAVSPVHNVFDAPPPHARLPGNLVSSGVKCCPHHPALTASIRVRSTSDSGHAYDGPAELRYVPGPDLSMCSKRVN